MTKTRRQSKQQQKAAADSVAAAESASAAPSSSQSVAAMTVTIPDDIDIEFLSNLLPDANLESPSADDIAALYRIVVNQAADLDATQREVEELKAEVERKDVELDQALQDKETATKDIESTLESTQKELRQVKQEKDELAAARAELQTKLASISTSQSASSTEVETLRHRVEDVEREKRDLIGVVSRLKEDSTQRDEEIHTLRSNLKQARQEYQTLEAQVRELRSTDTSNKFKLESLTQQLKLARDEVDRLTADLTAKTEEYANYRHQKHAELSQLQASHDSLAQTHTATDNTLKTLQSSHASQSHQLAQAHARIQELRGELAEKEATYSSEAANLRRLVKAMDEREIQAKAIVENIEKEWAVVGERAERREVVLREEIDAQRQRAEAAERKVIDLQNVLDRMDRGEFPIPSSASAPGTPFRGPSTPMRNGTPDFLSSGMAGLSPTVAIASRVQKSGKTFTEVYADYVKLQEEYTKQSIEYERMDSTLSAVLAQIEERAPLLAQQREEYERIQSEATFLADELKKAIDARDSLEKSSRDSEQKLVKSVRENEFLNKQLSDLGRQVQTLLRELGRAQDPSIPSDDILEQMTQPAENIEAVITNNLVLFRSIPELQEQNQKLLKIVRELGAKLEAEEKEYRAELEKEQSEAIQEAHQAIKLLQEQLQSQKKSADITIQTYMKERDALKSTLAKERSMGGQPRGVNGVNGRGPTATAVAEEPSEIQNQFDAYKTEMGEDAGRLMDEVLNSQREAGELGASLAKANAKIEFLNDRNRMLQEQIVMQSRELESQGRRNQELYDQYTRVDIECNRVSEDLLSSKSFAEQLRNECANLRAEKRIWESVQARLVEENRTLNVERSQLSDLMANVQRMHGDLERSGENDRRRLESQIQMLETQTQDLRTQLSQERDAIRHLALQKDLELKELRTRLDKTTQAYSETREALARAETSKKHLEEQVEQLSRQLQGNEEKLAVYERRATGAADVTQPTDQGLSREQQLEAEVAELRSALKVAEVDLATARSHVQQFQEISQANEAALASLNSTYDEYKATTESQLAMRESEFHSLEEKLAAAQQEIAQLSEKHSELQRTLESERNAWANDKRTLEGAIFDLTTSERSTESDRASREDAIHQQEERAKAAEEKYSREVIAHAESMKLVEHLKSQLSKAQASARDKMSAVETAQAKLVTSEASWKQQREALDKEMADLNARCKDLAAQNNLLHQHLESVTSQAARIRQAADSDVAASGEMEISEDTDTKLSELRSVVSYLRKEKEIVELQLELSKQENTRFKTQIEHLAHTLEETQKTLSEERERAVEAAASEAQHAELVERIQQLNILRESNATLRADCEANAKRARQLETKLEQLSAELEPVKEELRVTKAELEARNQQVKRLEEESRRWQERNTQLLTKYDRIDPAEVQSLKEQIEQLTQLKDKFEKKSSELGSQINKNNQIFRNKLRAVEAEKNDLDQSVKRLEGEIQAVTAERDSLKVQTAGESARLSREAELDKQIQTLRVQKAELEKALADERAAKVVAPSAIGEQSKLILTEERDKLQAEKASWVTPAVSTEEIRRQWEAERSELVKARDEALAQAQAARSQAEEVNKIKKINADLSARIHSLTQARAADRERAMQARQAAVAEAVEKVKQEIQTTVPTEPEDAAKRHAEELRALEERLTKQRHEELAKTAEAAKQLQPAGLSDEAQKAAIDAAVAAREKELKEAHEVEVTAAVERGRMEVAAKSKLKDAQLVRAQNRLKELEGKVAEWRQQGLIPEEPAASTATPTVKTTAPAKATAAGAKPTPPARPAPAVAGPSSTLPRKPVTAVPTTRGRGGAPAARGAGRSHAPAVGLSIRGSAHAGEAQSPAESTASMSIMGASKRAREDGDGAADDSLAKRIKPADGAGKPAPPVALRRDRVTGPS
ncbi:unnamed protein product [Somion occarium]|uniref:Nucleoprotein TPR/MLP1 domain-containing protein n=1 Tax=Somion occarium TaxID=3059160 RepID=A0ABP1DXE5_9APHY